LSGARDNALAETDLTFLGDCGLLKSFEAFLATKGDVFSLFAIVLPPINEIVLINEASVRTIKPGKYLSCRLFHTRNRQLTIGDVI
jgi:hypothetical protein